MNLDRLISMIINRTIRTFVNKGVDVGIDAGTKHLAKRRSAKTGQDAKLTPEEEQQAQKRLAGQAKKTVQNARKISRLSRRIGRF
ncbi:hypothetical protein [Celeribacter persicus]|jgi:hypothetical protein|uniref:Uncharacterized protein n=1 Tax=Celeribacter persicus TaxID=1651082 RepID=A0A2T5HUK6_9RHOB|nr:hypothetical protein [Celeribacter persicus]PTQ75270.1 hypothetical protein C8N42_102190 [Celeribacter persicus]